MESSTVTEYLCPPKKRRLDKASGESKSSATRPNLRKFDPYDDECIRIAYELYYYQFQKSDGFVIDWDKLEYRFDMMPMIDPYRDVACRAIIKHNADMGTKLVFVDHVPASYRWCSGVLYWITFWARDLASSSFEPKIYQTKCRRCGPTLCEISIFRLKPTDEETAAVQVDPPPPLNANVPEIAAVQVDPPTPLNANVPEIAAVQVDPPPPLNDDDPKLPTILFTVTGPGSGYMSILNVVFTRIPAEVESLSSPESSP